jgi:hypothetical protein
MVYPGLASWAKFSRPCGTKLVNPGSHTRSKARTLPRFALAPDKHFVKTPSELWEFDHYLTRSRKAIDAKYDYRCSRLPILFGQLIQNGQITVDDLLGLAEDKLALVRPAYESWAIPKRSGCRLNDIDGEFLQRNRLPCTRDRNPCPDAGLVIGRCGVYGYPAESASSVVLRPAWVMQSEARSISGKCGAPAPRWCWRRWARYLWHRGCGRSTARTGGPALPPLYLPGSGCASAVSRVARRHLDSYAS